MPSYKYVGDSPRSLPAYGIEIVSPGEVVETLEPLDNPQFQLIEKKKAAAPVAEKEASPEPVKEKK